MTNNFCDIFGVEHPNIEYKKCIKCNELRTLDKFANRSRNKNGDRTELRNDCNYCKTKETKVREKLKRYNPPPNFETYKCPYCKRMQKDMTWFGKNKKQKCFVMEHCHKTEKFRGYVCQDCNTVIARSNESPTVLRKIADMLELEGVNYDKGRKGLGSN